MYGCDAVEIRVDYLINFDDIFVSKQLSILRAAADGLPIIFTVRTKEQGGKFDIKNINILENLFTIALKSGVEFIDLELTLPTEVQYRLLKRKGITKIIGSHHDFEGKLSWTNKEWERKNR